MSNRNRTAKLRYDPSGFRIISPGDHVLCAITGERIDLDDLRYWSVPRQEPYASCEVSTRRHLEMGA